MKLFIFEYVDALTQSYHDGGGLVVVAKDLESAKLLQPAIKDTEPTIVYDLPAKYKEEASYVFPDTGCC